MDKKLAAKLGKMYRDELDILARKLDIKGYKRLSKTQLISALLNSNKSRLRKHLSVTWWDRYHNHVYGAIGIVGIVLSVVMFALETRQIPFEELLARAEECYWAGDFEKALDYYTEVLVVDPRSSEAWLGKAFCHLSREHGRLLYIGPGRSLSDFHRKEYTSSKDLDGAYESSMRALSSARTDLDELKANVVTGLVLLSMGCNCPHSGPGGMHSSPCCDGRGEPAYYFVDALRINQREHFSGSGSSLQRHNQRMFYSGMACDGMLTIANTGGNRWGLGKYLEEFGLD